MKKNFNLILMSYWRPVFGWLVDYLKDRNVNYPVERLCDQQVVLIENGEKRLVINGRESD